MRVALCTLAFCGLLLGGFWLANPWPSPAPIVGRVMDRDGPVAGAEVKLQLQDDLYLSTHTSAYGTFRFRFARPFDGEPRFTARKEGYFIAGTPSSASPVAISMVRLPLEDFEDYSWIDPVPDAGKPHNCGNCHAEIYREWSSNGHAHSATNRRFLNLYEGSDWTGRPDVGWSLRKDHPDGVGVCNACHAPTASFDADLVHLHGVAARGVHCDYCHKIADASTEQIGSTHGRFGVTLLRPAKGQIFFGPLDDVDRGEDVYSPLYSDSRYCASCHEGTVFGIHVYSTYSEWLNSSARKEGKQCQSCHMAPTGSMRNIAPGKGGIDRDPQTLASHRFFSGSQADMLLGCLQVSLAANHEGSALKVDVEVRADGVGHRVPTGFVDRHLILAVEALGPDDQLLRAREGPTLPVSAGKELAGRPGKVFARQLTDFEGEGPVPFWRARPETADSRLTTGRGDATTFLFPPDVDRVRIRLVYRRFWQQVTREKGWPDDSIMVVNKTLKVDGLKGNRWSNR